MKKSLPANICRAAAALLFIGAVIAQRCVGAGEWYARHLYPSISYLLSRFSSVVPISLEEVLAVLVVAGLAACIVRACKRRMGWKRPLADILTAAVGIYAWFYWGWGLNYSRDSIYERAGVSKCRYEEETFMRFLADYTDKLNSSYVPERDLDMDGIEREVKSRFAKVSAVYGLSKPQPFQHPKRVMFGRLYSGVGVLGYMGPFFAESQLNAELLPSQLPFTYTHELSHLLGVSGEAEANYWAYMICTASDDAYIRYSGYFGIFGYVAANARRLLTADAYRAWLQTVRKEVMEERAAQEDYWRGRYDKTLGKVQDKVYDFYLRRNRISSGLKNYAEVVSCIISLPEDCWE